MSNVHVITEPEAVLLLLHTETPDEKWFQMWEGYLCRKVSDREVPIVKKIMAHARNGANMQHDARQAAKVELAEMLESLVRQVKK